MFGIDPARFRSPALFLALALLLGCGLSRGSGDVEEIVDVEMPIEVDTSEDPQAVERPPQLVGVLPQDFPKDVPLYLPASLIDFGANANGRTVTLLTPHKLSRVRPAYEDLLRDAGWILNPVDSGVELSKGQRRVRLRWTGDGPGSEYLVEY